MHSAHPGRPTWADIDLVALRHNLEQARRFVLPHQRVLAVVKADAYGHGALPVSQALHAAGVRDFRSEIAWNTDFVPNALSIKQTVGV